MENMRTNSIKYPGRFLKGTSSYRKFDLLKSKGPFSNMKILKFLKRQNIFPSELNSEILYRCILYSNHIILDLNM